jgi:plastocyanin
MSPAEAALPRAARRACAIVLVALSIAGCGSGSDLGSSSTTLTADSAPGAAIVHVVMKSLDFSPLAISAKVGQTVTWTNEDSSPHNVTYVSGPKFTSSRPALDPGAKFSLRLTEPGTIHYYCSIHPWMKATIVVAP